MTTPPSRDRNVDHAGAPAPRDVAASGAGPDGGLRCALADFLHDLKQPLTALANYAKALEILLARPETQVHERARGVPAKMSAQVVRAADQIQGLQRLLDDPANTAGPCDLNAMVCRLLDLRDSSQAPPSGALALDLEASLPPALGPAAAVEKFLSRAISCCSPKENCAKTPLVTIKTERRDRERIALTIVAESDPHEGKSAAAMGGDDSLGRHFAAEDQLAAWKILFALHGGTVELGEDVPCASWLRLVLPAAPSLEEFDVGD